jgi:hypothetical protein
LENVVQHRHLTASIVVFAATEGGAAGYGGSKAGSNKPASITVCRHTRVADDACAAGGSIA